eukprot:267744-Rhodomonas_salina.2
MSRPACLRCVCGFLPMCISTRARDAEAAPSTSDLWRVQRNLGAAVGRAMSDTGFDERRCLARGDNSLQDKVLEVGQQGSRGQDKVLEDCRQEFYRTARHDVSGSRSGSPRRVGGGGGGGGAEEEVCVQEKGLEVGTSRASRSEKKGSLGSRQGILEVKIRFCRGQDEAQVKTRWFAVVVEDKEGGADQSDGKEARATAHGKDESD